MYMCIYAIHELAGTMQDFMDSTLDFESLGMILSVYVYTCTYTCM